MDEKLINVGPKELGQMQIGEASRKLYWNGQPLKTETGLKLTWPQKVIGSIVAITTFFATATTTISNIEKSCFWGFGDTCPIIEPAQPSQPALDRCGDQ